MKVTPQPARPGGPPILLGGYDRKAVVRAGRLADGYVTDETGLDEVRSNLALVDEGASSVGRDPNELSVVLLQNAFAWRDGDPWPLIREGLVQQLGTYEAWGNDADTPELDRLDPVEPVRRGPPPLDGRGNARGGARHGSYRWCARSATGTSSWSYGSTIRGWISRPPRGPSSSSPPR